MADGEGKVGLAVDSTERMFGDFCSLKVGEGTQCKLGLAPTDANSQIPNCPTCGPISSKIYRDGLRYNENGSSTQRWLCMRCGQRFSNKPLKSEGALPTFSQICAKEAKNLHVLKAKCVGTVEDTPETRAALKVFEAWMQKEGYKKNRKYAGNLLTLVHLGANLEDPESVKATIAAHTVKNGTKVQYCYSYEAYLTMQNKTWNRPGGRKLKYHQEENIIFIPPEAELDQLIAATNSKRLATYLQTLKETFTDPGEAIPIEWNDVLDRQIAIRHPVKDHRPRTLEVSEKLIAMINMLPHTSNRVFDCNYNNMLTVFVKVRRRLATKTQNPRINRIELRTYRHWAGTKIAELSNGNPITVMKMLGIRNVTNAMKYVDIWKLSFKSETDYDFLEVTTPEDLKIALLGGYTHVIDKFGASWFRRPKRMTLIGTQTPDTPLPSTETLCLKAKNRELNI
jgi:integrase